MGDSTGRGDAHAGVLVPELVGVPAGWFCMGCETGLDVEKPVHRVWVDAFAMAATQVTNQEFSLFLEAAPRAAPPFFAQSEFSHHAQPVVGVSWFQAVAYCEWISQETGRRFRLPTEAEWERAARGGKEHALYPWGNEPPISRPNYSGRWHSGPERVGQSRPNAYGLFEMCENVHEWCSDWYDPTYYSNSPERNPAGATSGERKASRGGSWRHHVKISRCATRSSIPPDLQYADYGFRLACDPE